MTHATKCMRQTEGMLLEAVEVLEGLRSLLDVDGEYVFRRADGEKMHLPDTMKIGDLAARGDEIIDKIRSTLGDES